MKKELFYYEGILTNGFVAVVPTGPCWCLHRVKPEPAYPFVLVKVRRKYWLFGELISVPGHGTVTGTDAECWRVPHRFDYRLKL